MFNKKRTRYKHYNLNSDNFHMSNKQIVKSRIIQKIILRHDIKEPVK